MSTMLPMIFKRKKTAEFLRQNSWEAAEKKKQAQHQQHQKPRTFDESVASTSHGGNSDSFEGVSSNPGYAMRGHSSSADGYLSAGYVAGGLGMDRRRSASPVGSGEWALRECENHTTWLNEFRRRLGLPQITDLRLAVADGVTIVQLTEALTNSEVAYTDQEGPLSRPQALVHLDRCLAHLASRGVDVIGIQASDLVEGDLKSSLLLLSQIRRKFDPTYGRRPQGDGRLSPKLSERPTPVPAPRTDPTPNMPGRIDTSPQVPRAAPLQRRDKSSLMRRGLAVDEDRMLPGTLGNEDGDPRSLTGSADAGMKMNTDHTSFGYPPQSSEDRRTYHYSQSGGSAHTAQTNKPVPAPRPPQGSTGVTSERPPTTLGVAWAANSTPKPRQTADTPSTPQHPSVEERLRNLMMDNQRSTNQYEDGELLLPPPPSRDFGDGVTLGGLAANQADAPRPLNQSLDGSFTQMSRDPVSGDQGYVPSKPSEKRRAPPQRDPSRPQAEPSATTNPASPSGQYTNYAYVSDTQSQSSVYSESQRSGQKASDLRSAWNKLYGPTPEWRPVSRPDVTSAGPTGMRNGMDRTASQEHAKNSTTPDFKRRTSHPSPSMGIRQSPMGQIPVALQNSHGHMATQDTSFGPIPSMPRESPMGQSSSTYGQTSGGSTSSHHSSYSAAGTTFSTFKPDPGGDEKEEDEEDDKELGSMGVLDASSKYPDSNNSRPSSARLTPQTPQSFQSSSFGMREAFSPGSRPSVHGRSEVRQSPRSTPRGPTPNSARTASRDSLNTSFPPKPGGVAAGSSRLDGGLSSRPPLPSGAKVNPAYATDSGDDGLGDAGSSPRGAQGSRLGGGSGLGNGGDLRARTQSLDGIDPNDSVFDYNRRHLLRGMSESSSNRSVTPPLPPLSPSSSQPGSDPSSPRREESQSRDNPHGFGVGQSSAANVNSNRPHSAMAYPAQNSTLHQRSRSALASPKTPDLLVTSTDVTRRSGGLGENPSDLGRRSENPADKRVDGGKGGGNRHHERGGLGHHLTVPDRRDRGNSRGTWGDEPHYSAGRYFARSRSLDDVRESGTESNNLSFDVDNTMLTVEPSDLSELEPSLSHAPHGIQHKDARAIKGQLHKLEVMYHDVMKLMGAERTHGKSGRRWSIASSETSSLKRGRHLRASSSSSKAYGKDLRSIQKRFQRLESHVVTLARSLAHLSSEMRAHNSVKRDLEQVKRDIRELKQQAVTAKDSPGGQFMSFDRFRGWIPSLSNPYKRINKLTQFFGQEPPLLMEIFLKKLGYERYAKNFAAEHIGMIELPYMTEERLESIGIPLGPRLRILQESQLCFRQENFDIYIV